MLLLDGCHSLKLECALRDLGFIDMEWRTVANAGIFFVQPVGMPDDPEGDLFGLTITYESKVIKMQNTAKKALDTAIKWSGKQLELCES